MQGQMKALQILEPGKVVWRETPIPPISKGQVLVKVLGVTTCPHWDLHMMAGEPMFPGAAVDYPLPIGQPGHEAMGDVVALGPDAPGPAVGTRVVAWRDQGHARPGCYAQYVPFEADNVLAIPAHLRVEEIAPLELAMCVQVSFDQLQQIDAVRDARFAVGGLGPAGLIAVQLARSYGAREVIALDPLAERRALAQQLGATVALAPSLDVLPAGRHQPGSFDTALDCTGLKASVEFLMDRTSKAVAVFGVLREEVGFGLRHWMRGLTLLGYGSHNRAAAERALRLVLEGQLRLAPLVTHQLPFTRYMEGVELLRAKQAIKVAFLPWATADKKAGL